MTLLEALKDGIRAINVCANECDGPNDKWLEAAAVLARLEEEWPKLAEVVASMRRSLIKPMRAWSTGDVVGTDSVEWWADELDAILSRLDAAQKEGS